MSIEPLTTIVITVAQGRAARNVLLFAKIHMGRNGPRLVADMPLPMLYALEIERSATQNESSYEGIGQHA